MAEIIFATAFAAVLQTTAQTLLAPSPPEVPDLAKLTDDNLLDSVADDQRRRTSQRLAPPVASAQSARIGNPQTILGPGVIR